MEVRKTGVGKTGVGEMGISQFFHAVMILQLQYCNLLKEESKYQAECRDM